jgi:hypothetical protein
VVSFTTACFTPGEGAPGTHRMEGWVGPRAGVDAVEKEKISCSDGNRTPAVQPVARHYTDCAIAARTSEITLIGAMLNEGLMSTIYRYLTLCSSLDDRRFGPDSPV